MQELKIHELQQVSGGWLPVAVGIAAGAVIAVGVAAMSAGYNDGRADRYR